MDSVELIADVLKYVVPALLVLLTVRFMRDSFLQQERDLTSARMKTELVKERLPLKLNAYERGILFLERINPENLLIRIHPLDKQVSLYHQELVHEIRTEYEHNLSQQLYMNNQAWASLVNAKEEILSIIHGSAKELGKEDSALELSKKILNKWLSMEVSPTQKAIFVIKNDANSLFS
ncbi:MAG: hypothetical protein AAGD28_10225 [Bacteroidota bacterium]